MIRTCLFVVLATINGYHLLAQNAKDSVLVDQALEIIYNKDKTDDSKAILLLNRAIEINPKNAEAFCYRGLLKNLAKKNTEAMADYDKAISLNRNMAEAYKGRGIVKDNTKDYSGAISDYNMAIQLKPDMVVYHYRGSAKMMLGQTESACADFKKSCELGFSYGCSDYRTNCQ